MDTLGRLPGALDLGSGHHATWLFHAGAAIPWAIYDTHEMEGTRCTQVIPWSPRPGRAGDPLWTVESLHPLSLVEPIECPSCGQQGRIAAGRWVPL